MTSSAVIDLITALWLGFIGACIGSFLNVVAYRMPRGESVIWTPSHCPKCDHPIRAYDNVPVLGWLWLKGKCRDCKEPISPRYAIVEFVMGLAFFILAYAELFTGGANLPGGPITEFTGAVGNVWNPQWKLIGVYAYHGLLLSLLMSFTLIDLDNKVAPRILVVLGLLLALSVIWMQLRSLIAIDWYSGSRQGWGRVRELFLANWGMIFGAVLGRILSLLLRGQSSSQEKRTHSGVNTNNTGMKPYGKLQNLLFAFLFAGYFLGDRGIFLVFVFTATALCIAQFYLIGNRWRKNSFVLPFFWSVVVALIVFGNFLASNSPL